MKLCKKLITYVHVRKGTIPLITKTSWLTVIDYNKPFGYWTYDLDTPTYRHISHTVYYIVHNTLEEAQTTMLRYRSSCTKCNDINRCTE